MALLLFSSTATWATFPMPGKLPGPSGWTPDSDQEIFSRDELNEQFSLSRVAKNPAVFDIEKLNWINFHYMKELDEDQLYTCACRTSNRPAMPVKIRIKPKQLG